jgi:release factor glutamine methyltransferase
VDNYVHSSGCGCKPAFGTVPSAMSAPPVSQPLPAVTDRLRAAGSVFAESEAELLVGAAQSSGDLAALVDLRITGVPLEHILGWVDFCGVRIAVDPGVFVPRRRTGLLVRQAADLLRHAAAERPVAVDLCCGSGAVGAVLLDSLDLELHAVDIDPLAVGCARRNLPSSGRVYEGDLYGPLPSTLRGRVDVVVANAPYVPTDAVGMLPPEAREHEPRPALDGGADGLDVLRRVVVEAPQWLAPGGHLLVETSQHQAPRLAEIFGRNGLAPRVIHCEESDACAVIGTAPPLTSAQGSAGVLPHSPTLPR